MSGARALSAKTPRREGRSKENLGLGSSRLRVLALHPGGAAAVRPLFWVVTGADFARAIAGVAARRNVVADQIRARIKREDAKAQRAEGTEKTLLKLP